MCLPHWMRAAAAGLAPVKINAVLMRGVNDHEAADLLAVLPWSAATTCGSSSRCRWTPATPGSAPAWSPPTRSWRRCPTRFELRPAPSAARRGARRTVRRRRVHVDGRPATVGVIASVTRPFCGDCDRTRLTADGQIRTCLFARTETDLRGLLRAGADDEIADAWRAAMWAKLPGHGINDDVVPAAGPPDECDRWMSDLSGPTAHCPRHRHGPVLRRRPSGGGRRSRRWCRRTRGPPWATSLRQPSPLPTAPKLARVLALLVPARRDGRARARNARRGRIVLDVLPPFAGG